MRVDGARLIGPGHLIAAVCFVVLAHLRFIDGAPIWGLVFLAAAGSQLYLALTRTGRLGTRTAGAASTAGGSRRSWRLMTVSASALTVWLLAVEPALSIIAAGIALYCARSTRRAIPSDRPRAGSGGASPEPASSSLRRSARRRRPAL